MRGGVEVRTSAASTLPGDAVVRLGPADIEATVVEPFGEGRVVVHGTAGTDTWAFTGPVGRDRSGVVRVEVVVDGWRFDLEVESRRRAVLRRRGTREPDAAVPSGPTEIRAIIPGRIAAVHVRGGDVVEAGQGLLVVEAMKMQNELRAPAAGTVERVAVEAGQTVDNGDLLVVFR